MLLGILDDYSRLICHAQWYLDETVETLVHGFMQALQKRALPRALMSDNGAAMMAGEFIQGLERLSILHQPTLPYSPYQNAKQEVFWAQVEGRLLPMLESEKELTLAQLNEATIAWVEFEYHKKLHSELSSTPLERYLSGQDVGRDCPDTQSLRQAFCIRQSRKQRKSDGSFSLCGKRFEVPNQYRHLETLHVHLIDTHTGQLLCALYPQDKSENATGLRRAYSTQEAQLRETKCWGSFKTLRERWLSHLETALLRPIIFIDEAQETPAAVLNELRLLASAQFDSRILLSVILAGDQRLNNKLRHEELIPLGSRIRIRFNTERASIEQLLQCMQCLLTGAGNPKLMTQELTQILCEHAMGNYRVLCTMAAELLDMAARQERIQLDEKLYLECFAPPVTQRKRKSA